MWSLKFVYIITKMLGITDPLCLFLSQTSIRNLSRTCKGLLRIRTKIREQDYDKFLFSAKHSEKYEKRYNLTLLDKYTLEILLDGDTKLIPQHYICAKNNVIFSMPYVYSAFAKRGSVDVLEFLIGIYINQKIDFKFESDIICGAAEGGWLNIIKWVKKTLIFDFLCECINDPDNKDCPRCYAAFGGYTNIIDYFDAIWRCTNLDLRNYAAKNGKYHVIAHLDKKDQYPDNDIEVSLAAVQGGQLETLKWLKVNEYYQDHWVFVEAAKIGNLPIIKWAMENNCGWNKLASDMCLKEGTVEVIEWLRTNNKIL